MTKWYEYLFGAIVVSELYNKFATPNEKYEWENKVNIHHGAAGTLITIAGVLADSPKLIGTGLGLMIHDWDDRHKWFNNSKSNIVVPSSPFYV